MFKSLKPLVSGVMLMSITFMLAGCLKEKQVVVLSAANTVAAQTVGEIYAQALEAANYRVERRFSLATASQHNAHTLHYALRDGHIDIYVGYTGDEALMFGKEPAANGNSVYDELKKIFEEEEITLLEPVPANDAYTLAVLSGWAAAEKIETFTELFEKTGGLKLAIAYAFKKGKDGFGLLEKYYGENSFAEVIVVQTKDLYPSLDSKKVEVAAVRRNDGLLSDAKYKALRDDRGVFVPQVITPVVKKSFIENNEPVRGALDKVSATLDDNAMIELNRQLTVENRNYKKTAKKYLNDSGLLKK